MKWVAVLVLSGCSSVLGIEDFKVAGDADAETGFCVGPQGDWRVCLPAEPTMARNITSATTIATDMTEPCEKDQPTGWTDQHQPACFVIGTNITISAPVRAVGARPLVLVASGKITVSTGGIDVAGHRSLPMSPAGANAAACNAPTVATGTSGGAGGSFMTKAGDGGKGLSIGATAGMAADRDSVRPKRLRGGCPAGVGGAGTGSMAGTAGEGGGAIYVVAGEAIEVNHAFINASGAAGGGAESPSGGGGGGSGGMIVLYAPTISGLGGNIIAHGGGGGGGAGGGVTGNGGEEASTTDLTMVPQGGPGGSVGGRGGAGFPADAALMQGGLPSTGPGAAGGGGGGGGGGFVMAPPWSTLASSPASVAFP